VGEEVGAEAVLGDADVVEAAVAEDGPKREGHEKIQGK
jgi:hypothetical protein